jgi:phosphoribosylaminoimidazole carboxylase PurE protein
MQKEIAIVMSSDSDLDIMKGSIDLLDQFGIQYEVAMLAIHRNPERMFQYAKAAHTRGLRVIIAGAGGAAHLPGMLAAITPLPVIGVPIKEEHSIDGLDAIYSMLQMPQGVPVAVMALNGAANAALYALKILGSSHPSYFDLVAAYKKKQLEQSDTIANQLESMGFDDYYAQTRGIEIIR